MDSRITLSKKVLELIQEAVDTMNDYVCLDADTTEDDLYDIDNELDIDFILKCALGSFITSKKKTIKNIQELIKNHEA